jgi:hypothetical protein
MFRPNKHHHQGNLFGWQYILNAKQYELLMKSAGYAFYNEIFCQIDESLFSVLYSKKYSAPNVAVNVLVGAILLQYKYNWTEKELIEHLSFDVQTRIALGLSNFDVEAFSIRSLYNFKKRLAEYQLKTGVNLISLLFTFLTDQQITKYDVTTRIQRGDSVQIGSHIQDYSRLSLLAEVLNRLHRCLSKEDQAANEALFKPYLKGGQKYVYRLKSDKYTSCLAQIASHYRTLFILLYEEYHENETFCLFERALNDHFDFSYERTQLADATINVKENKDLGSDTLQSPDDPDATFRGKRGEKHKGYTITGVETCDPNSDLNLLVAIDTNANNIDDSTILEQILPDMLAMTEDLEEAHFDGGYGSEKVDEIAQEHDVNIVQTALRGAIAKVNMDIIHADETLDQTTSNQTDSVKVNCPNEAHPAVTAQKVNEKKGKLSYKAVFDLSICEQCPFKDHCPTKRERNKNKGVATFRFNQQYIHRQKRRTAQSKLPDERKYLRSGVESTMRSFRRGETNKGKIKYRGLFNTELYANAMGIILNFERIYRHNVALLIIFWRFCCSAALLSALALKANRKTNKFILYPSV